MPEGLFRRALQRRLEPIDAVEDHAAEPAPRTLIVPPPMRDVPTVPAMHHPLRRMESQVRRRVKLAVVIEDDMIVRAGIAAMLSDLGYGVVEASTLEEARRVLTSVRPDVLVLDYEIDGDYASTLLDELVYEQRATSTVLTSASPLAIDAARQYRIELVQEPFALETLADVVQQVVTARSSVPLRRAS